MATANYIKGDVYKRQNQYSVGHYEVLGYGVPQY